MQRNIEDIQSEAANAADMKAAASGNPLILMQVQLSGDLRKLEALYSQHQREQYRLRDRLKWLENSEKRLADAEAEYVENIRCRDANTRMVTEKDKKKILVELHVDGKVLKARDNEKMRDLLIGGVKEVTRNSSAKVLFGTYRGFDVHVERSTKTDGFRLCLKGAGGQEFRPENLVYAFDEKFSLAGLFQRIDNFLAKGLDEAIAVQRENARQDQAEMATVKAALGKAFPQIEELELVRENHAAVMRELKRMQDQPGYVSTWTPKTASGYDVPAVSPNMGGALEEPKVPASDVSVVPENPPAKKEALYQKLTYSDKEGTSQYSVSNQHNGHILDGFVVRRTFYNQQVGSLGHSLYDDGHWYTTATAPAGLGLKQFATQEDALQVVRNNARERGLQAGSQVHPQPFGTTKLTFGKAGDKIEYTAFNHTSYCTLERAHFRGATRYPVYMICDDNLWRIPQCIHKNVKTRKFASTEEALAFARRDAIEQGLHITESKSLENNYHARLEEAGFHATGKDFFGKNEYSSIVKASDGGIFSLRLFQHEDKIGFHSQYEKGNIIDGRRTVKATFDNLDKALEFVSGYHVPMECRDTRQQSYRMRM